MKRAREEFEAAYDAHRKAHEEAQEKKRALTEILVNESLPLFKKKLHDLDTERQFTEIIDRITGMRVRYSALFCTFPDVTLDNWQGIRADEVSLPIVTKKNKWIRAKAQQKMLPVAVREYKDFIFWLFSEEIGAKIHNAIFYKSTYSDDLDDFFYEIKGV